MAKTIINLSDPVSTLVTKSNTISSHLGDITQLNVGASNDSDIVQAINFINDIVQKTDSADIINLIDSSYVQARQTGVTRSSVLGFFIKDSANGIGFDSSEGRFFVPSNTINTAATADTALRVCRDLSVSNASNSSASSNLRAREITSEINIRSSKTPALIDWSAQTRRLVVSR